MIVHLDDLTPVRRDLGEVKALGEINKVENVLLEARAAKADRGLEELGAHARVAADGMGDFVDIGASGLANGRQGIDRRNTLCEHGIGSELGEFRGPEADGEDAFAGDPVGIDVLESGTGVLALLGLERANEDAVGLEEIVDGCALGQELGIGEDVEAAARLGVGLEDGAHRLGRATGHSRLFNDNLGRCRDLGDSTRRKFDITTRVSMHAPRGEIRT